MDYSIDKLLTTAVAQLCVQSGFSSSQMGAFNILKDITRKYLKRTVELTKIYAEHNNRSYPLKSDVLLTYQHMGINGSEMSEFIFELGDLMPYSGLTIAGPVGSRLDLSVPGDSHPELGSRPSYIPKHLPLLKRDEPVEAEPAVSQSVEVSESEETQNASKRVSMTQRTEYEATPCSRRISCVTIDAITGELIPLTSRQGKLPDLKLLANLKTYRRPSPQKKKRPLSPRINDLNTTTTADIDESAIVDEHLPTTDTVKSDSHLKLPAKSLSDNNLNPFSNGNLSKPMSQSTSDAQWSAALLATPASYSVQTTRRPEIFLPAESSLAVSSSDLLNSSTTPTQSGKKYTTSKKKKPYLGTNNGRKRPPPKSSGKRPREKKIKLEPKRQPISPPLPVKKIKKVNDRAKSPSRGPLSVITSFGSDTNFTSSADTKDSTSSNLLGRQEVGDGIVRSPRRRKPSLIAVEAIMDKDLNRSENKKQCKTPPAVKTPVRNVRTSFGATTSKLKNRALVNNPSIMNTLVDTTKTPQSLKVRIKIGKPSKSKSKKTVSPKKSPKLPKTATPKFVQSSPIKSTTFTASTPSTSKRRSLELDSGEETDPMTNDITVEEPSVPEESDNIFPTNINKGTGIRLRIKIGTGPNPENTSSLTGNETPSTPQTPPMREHNLSPSLSVEDLSEVADDPSKSCDDLDSTWTNQTSDIPPAKISSHSMGPPLVTKIILGPTLSIVPSSRPPELHKLTPLILSKQRTDPSLDKDSVTHDSTSSKHSESGAASPVSSLSSLEGNSSIASPIKIEKLERHASVESQLDNGVPKIGELSPLNTPSSSFNGEPFKSESPPHLSDLSRVENQSIGHSPNLQITSEKQRKETEFNEIFVPFVTSTANKTAKPNTSKKRRRGSFTSKRKRPAINKPLMRVDSVFSEVGDTTLNDSSLYVSIPCKEEKEEEEVAETKRSVTQLNSPKSLLRNCKSNKKRPTKKPRKTSPVRSNTSVKNVPPSRYKPGTSHYYDENNKEKVWLCPVCHQQDNGTLMVGCDNCDDWYHGACLNITSEPEEECWFCSHCQLIKAKKPSTNKKSSKSTLKTQSNKKKPSRKR